MSSIVQSSATAHQPPGRSVAVPVLPSPQLMENVFPSIHFSLWNTEKKSQDAKSANMEDVQVFECVYWEETSRKKKGVVSWGIVLMQHPDFVLPEIRRFFRKVCRTVALLIPTMSAIILTLRRRTLRTISLIF